jgi:hypothetical protein
MRTQTRYLLIILVVGISIFATLKGWADAPSTQPLEPISSSSYDGPPPQIEHVSVRQESAGARSPDSTSTSIYAWCPDETGATVKERPLLAWYLSQPTLRTITVTLSNEEKHKSIHLWTSTGKVSPGIHLLDTSSSGFSLEEGVAYKWTVRVINDETDPSKDLFSSGFILRMSASDPTAAGHAFYDAIGSAIAALDDASKSTDNAGIDPSKQAISVLLDKVKLSPPDLFIITRDSSAP